MKKYFAVAAASCLMPLWASAAAFTNGDFESGATAWTFTAPAATFDISAYGSCCGATGTYPSGSKIASFGGGDKFGGVATQSFDTRVGQQYLVSFQYGAFIGGQTQTMQSQMLDGATVLGTLTATDTSATNDMSLLMSRYSYAFVATSLSTTIKFTDVSAATNGTDGLIDDVSVTAVAEPGTYALMLSGIAAMTLVARRRQQR